MVSKNNLIKAELQIQARASDIFQILTNPNRHKDFDGSGMLRGAVHSRLITAVGDTFTLNMHRLGDDYLMINYVVEFVQDRRIFWEPAPGDISRAEGHDPSKIGIPAGYRWGYILTPDVDDSTIVTEIADYSSLSEDLFLDGGVWMNGANSVYDSMVGSLKMLEKICTE